LVCVCGGGGRRTNFVSYGCVYSYLKTSLPTAFSIVPTQQFYSKFKSDTIALTNKSLLNISLLHLQKSQICPCKSRTANDKIIVKSKHLKSKLLLDRYAFAVSHLKRFRIYLFIFFKQDATYRVTRPHFMHISAQKEGSRK